MKYTYFSTVIPTIELALFNPQLLNFFYSLCVKTIFFYFLPLDHQESAYGLPVLQALKLVRVLTARNEILANKFVNEWVKNWCHLNSVKCISVQTGSDNFMVISIIFSGIKL